MIKKVRATKMNKHHDKSQTASQTGLLEHFAMATSANPHIYGGIMALCCLTGYIEKIQ
jgi:hypothetical protein